MPSATRDINLPETLTLLRQKLSQKAKQEPKFRFYALYDRIYRRDTLLAAWWLVLANRGAPGIDGVTVDEIVATDESLGAFLDEIQEALRTKQYQPSPVMYNSNIASALPRSAAFCCRRKPALADAATPNVVRSARK